MTHSRLTTASTSSSRAIRGSLFGTLAVSLCALILGTGCIPFGDPGGPGASGQVSLGAGVSADSSATLWIRAAPAGAGAFDASAPSFPAGDGEGAAWTGDGSSGADLTSVAFPFDYSISESLGTTPEQHWRLFAWLSASAPGSAVTAPASGEPYGTVTFDVGGCEQYGDYCGVTEGVNVTIDQVAP